MLTSSGSSTTNANQPPQGGQTSIWRLDDLERHVIAPSVPHGAQLGDVLLVVAHVHSHHPVGDGARESKALQGDVVQVRDGHDAHRADLRGGGGRLGGELVRHIAVMAMNGQEQRHERGDDEDDHVCPLTEIHDGEDHEDHGRHAHANQVEGQGEPPAGLTASQPPNHHSRL